MFIGGEAGTRTPRWTTAGTTTWLPDLDAPFLSVDDVEATRMAVDHLIDLGHVRIGAVMGPSRYSTTRRKIAGYELGTRDLAQTPGTELVVNSVFSVEGGYAAMQVLLGRDVTAVVCGSDLMALGAIRAVRGHGLEVPGDVSVIGYDDSPLLSFTDPPLTTVQQDVSGISRQAVDALMDEMNGVQQPRHELLFSAQLVVRGSTGPAVHLRPARPRDQDCGSAAQGLVPPLPSGVVDPVRPGGRC